MTMPFPDGSETRTAVEFRIAGRRLVGYAAVFGQPARIGRFTETIDAGAFSRTLAGNGDILALVDHDPTRLLARSKSGTLRLSEDSRGLHFDLDVPDTTLGRDVMALAERRDLGGMSFSFVPKVETWNGVGGDKRVLRDVDLLEVSIVAAFPAYAGTSVAVRSAAALQGAAWRRRYVECLT